MVWKIVLIFLCAMVLVAMIGKLLFPGRAKGRDAKNLHAKAARCSHCGKPQIGTGRCSCGKGVS